MSSNVWKYFTIDMANSNYAKCKFCSKLISRGGASKSTSSLNKHLKTKHESLLGPSGPNSYGKIKKPAIVHQSGPDQPSTSGSKSDNRPRSTLDLFVKPKSKAAADDYSLGPTEEEMDIENDLGLLENKTPPLGLDENLLIDTSYHNISSIALDIISPNSNISTSSVSIDFDDQCLSSPISPAQETGTSPTPSPALYPKAIRIPTKKQSTIERMYERKMKFTADDPRAIKISNLIAEMVCLDLQPISIVEDEGFLRLLNHLEPKYNIPSRKTFSNKILLKMYQKKLNEVKLDLRHAKHVAITTDMWTSVANCDFMAVTAHYVCEKTNKVVHKCLECVPFPEISHTAVNILKFLDQVFKDWGIQDSIVGIVRDNGADITAALNRSEYEAYSCVAHTLQLVIKDGCIDHPKISNVIKKAKKIVGNFKKSAKNTKVLKSLQKQLNLREHRLIQEEPTRWNTTYYMFKRLVEQKDALILMSGKPEVTLTAELTSDDFKTMQFAVEILEIFETATRQVSKESSSISEVIPLINTIQHFLTNLDVTGSGLMGLKNDIVSSLKRRYANVEDNTNLAVATLLDPRFKAAPFTDNVALEKAKQRIIEEMGETEASSPEPAEREVAEANEKSNEKSFWRLYSAFTTTGPSPAAASETTCSYELKTYLEEKTFAPKEEGGKVFQYWGECNFQRLKKVAFKYLCIPPATVFSERLFSTAGLVCDKKRNRLDPDRVKMLVFLHKNLNN